MLAICFVQKVDFHEIALQNEPLLSTFRDLFRSRSRIARARASLDFVFFRDFALAIAHREKYRCAGTKIAKIQVHGQTLCDGVSRSAEHLGVRGRRQGPAPPLGPAEACRGNSREAAAEHGDQDADLRP